MEVSFSPNLLRCLRSLVICHKCQLKWSRKETLWYPKWFLRRSRKINWCPEKNHWTCLFTKNNTCTMQLYSLNILSFYYSIVLSARHSTVKYDHFARQTYSRDDLIIVGIFSCSVKTKTFLSENLHTFCKFYREIKCIFFSIHIDSRQILGCSPGSFSLFVSPGSFYSIHCYSGPNLDL